MITFGKNRGHLETLDNKFKLDLYLLFVTSWMEIKFLCLIFGEESCFKKYFPDNDSYNMTVNKDNIEFNN